MVHRPRWWFLGLVVLLGCCPLLSGCSTPAVSTQDLRIRAGGWFAAIHDRNFDRLAAFDANAPEIKGGPEFEAWKAQVAQALDRYEAQKLQGKWEPDPIGYAIVRASMVGLNPGTFWGVPAVEGTKDQPVLVIRAAFAYDEIGEQRYPPGQKLFLQGFPIGTVHRLEIGGQEKPEVDILDVLYMRLYFQKASGVGEGKTIYKIRRIEIDPTNVQHRRVKWVF